MVKTGLGANRRLYDRFWKRMPVTPPQWFSTWKLVGKGRDKSRIVEIGPGTRPRAPIESTLFLDLSISALKKLKGRGGRGSLADGGRLPVRTSAADMVVAFDVLEHVEGEEKLFREIGRVLKPGGEFVFSVPLHPRLFDRFDRVAGHLRRYEPAGLDRGLAEAGFEVTHWFPFGSRPGNGWLNRTGAWWLERYPSWCAWTRDTLFRMVGRYFQRDLCPGEGGLAGATEEVGGALVKARKRAR
ncbi:MAG: class I SAM-dependent DNA methyltransferase [Planctomycetota bacterium]|jgi:SAM-dependent methyltransferase